MKAESVNQQATADAEQRRDQFRHIVRMVDRNVYQGADELVKGKPVTIKIGQRKCSGRKFCAQRGRFSRIYVGVAERVRKQKRSENSWNSGNQNQQSNSGRLLRDGLHS